MSRTRLIKPAFFKHYDLYVAERESGLPLRVAFAGLWTVTDKAGRFRWKADIKPDILPYDQCDVLEVLRALEARGFVERYEVDGKSYGLIPSFGEHQTFHKTERQSEIPAPPASNGKPTVNERETPVRHTSVTGTVAVAGTGAVTVAAEERPPVIIPATAERKPTGDPVSALLAEHDFGPFRDSIEGLCRSARHPASVISTLRMHISGEMSHEEGTPLEVGLAAQQFLAAGQDFAPLHFAGWVRRAKKGAERMDNRRRNDSEERRIQSEEERERRDLAEEQRVDQELRAFERDYPDQFAAYSQRAERSVKATGATRSVMVRLFLVDLVRKGAESAA